MLYLFTASNDSAIKNLEATIEKPYPISKCLAGLDADTVTKLKDNELHENVCGEQLLVLQMLIDGKS
ncbi:MULTISPECIES: hypothetical protein [Bacillus]|uniref:hypothetical protein n=1 Tax=Bacillus TaxID=1386 RepID=UPI000AF55A21|nr:MULTISPECIES: hypothetical protein [Bacillus cereus group]